MRHEKVVLSLHEGTVHYYAVIFVQSVHCGSHTLQTNGQVVLAYFSPMVMPIAFILASSCSVVPNAGITTTSSFVQCFKRLVDGP